MYLLRELSRLIPALNNSAAVSVLFDALKKWKERQDAGEFDHPDDDFAFAGTELINLAQDPPTYPEPKLLCLACHGETSKRCARYAYHNTT